MKNIYMDRIISMIVLGLFLSVLIGCAKAKKPPRKMLPVAFIGNQLQEEFNPSSIDKGQPFFTGDTSLLIAGVRQNLLSISLPDPQFDEIAMRIAKAYQYEALTDMLWSMLLDDHKSGVLVSFVNGNQEHKIQTQFLSAQSLQHPGKKLPIVFRWDAGSAARANAFIKELNQVSYIKLNYYTTDADCFSSQN